MGDECQWETDLYDPATEKQVKKKHLSQGEIDIIDGGLVMIGEDDHWFIDIDTYAHNNKGNQDLFILF